MKERMIEVKIHYPRAPVVATRSVVDQAREVVSRKGLRDVAEASHAYENCHCYQCLASLARTNRFYKSP